MTEKIFKIDTFEKAFTFYSALTHHEAVERLTIIFNAYPELIYITHEELAELSGLARETVTRAFTKLRDIREKRNSPEAFPRRKRLWRKRDERRYPMDGRAIPDNGGHTDNRCNRIEEATPGVDTDNVRQDFSLCSSIKSQ
jgi:hypothetical protein